MGGQEVPVEECEGSPAHHQRSAPVSGAPSAHGSGRVLTDAVLHLQQDTIHSFNNVSNELQQIRKVLEQIAELLKNLIAK